MKNIALKRGDTLKWYVMLTDSDGAAITGIAENLKCQIRDSIDGLVDDVTITETEIPGQYLFTVSSTEDFPVGLLYSDIELTDEVGTKSSETFSITIEKDVTKNAGDN